MKLLERQKIGRIINSRHRLSLVAFSVFIVLSISLTFWHSSSQISTSDYYEVIEASDLTKGAARIKTGIFVQKVYDFDPESKTFWADGYFWIKWKDDIAAYNTTKVGDGNEEDINKTSISNPMSKVEFLNAVEHQQSLKRVTWPETPYKTKDGWNYQSDTFSGKFLAARVDLSRFPFETLELPIEIETDGFWITEVVFDLDDIEGQGVSTNNELQGYSYKSFEASTRKHIYRTSFGLTADAIEGFKHPHKSIYPNFIATIKYHREPRSTAWQLFVPLIAVLVVTIVSPLIDSSNIEPKVALPASVILALVFLQQGYRNMIPKSISYLTYMDKLYGVAYVITVAVFAYAVLSTNIYLRSRNTPRLKAYMDRLKRFESKFNMTLVVLLMTLPALIWFAS